MSDVPKEDDQDTPANKPDVPKAKKKPPANEDGLSTKCDVWSKSTRPRVFLVADVSNDDKSSAKSKNSIPSLMSNGIDALTRRKIATWEQKRIQMAACQTYEEFVSIVRSTNIDHHFEIPDGICHAKTSFHIDLTAQHFYPQDGPEHLIPCKCHGDGNCFVRALSNLLFGTEDHYLALCAAAVFETVIHKNYYLDDIYRLSTRLCEKKGFFKRFDFQKKRFLQQKKRFSVPNG